MCDWRFGIESAAGDLRIDLDRSCVIDRRHDRSGCFELKMR